MKVIFLVNESVIYIDYLGSYLDILSDRFPKWVRKIVYSFLNFLGYVIVNDNRIRLCCLANDKMNNRMIERLKKSVLLMGSRDVVLSDLLLQNVTVVSVLQGLGYNILRGKWLYKFLCYDIVEKIACVRGKRISDLEVTVLSNEDSEINVENIKLLAKECRILNVVTENLNAFRYVEEFLFNEYGSVINVSTNKHKTCKYSDVVLNFDFSIAELRECNFKKGVVLVQFTKERFENRYGSTIVFYKLNFPAKYLNLFGEYGNYNREIFYESLLYYKTSFKNLRKILRKDGISIRYFVGCNGKLPFCEIKNNLG